MEMSLFNVNDGYLEGICRGLKASFLTKNDYRRISAAETLEDLRSALEETDYGGFMQDEPLPLAVPTIVQKAREKMAADFQYMRSQAYEPLASFLDFIATEKMVDNMVSLIQGALNKKPAEELLARANPMGMFAEIRAIATMNLASSHEDLYRSLLVESPVGKYFEGFLQGAAGADENGRSLTDVAQIVTEADIDVLRNTLKKGWFEDFYDFVQTLEDTTTREVMTHILKTEADFRVLSLAINFIGSEEPQAMQERHGLYPNFGYLYPEGTDKIRKAWNDSSLRVALEPYPKYLNVYDQCRAFYVRDEREVPDVTMRFKSLEDLLFSEIVSMCELAFDQQFHFGKLARWEGGRKAGCV